MKADFGTDSCAREAKVSSGWSSSLLGGDEASPGPHPAGSRARGNGLRLSDYLEAPLRHPWWVVVPFVLCVAGATAAAFLLPERFAASCLVLIKASGVPDKIVSNVSEELSARRHQTIRQEILSRTRLEKVNEELHPYPEIASPTVVIATMQAAIEVKFRGSDAFTIQFTHRDPAHGHERDEPRGVALHRGVPPVAPEPVRGRRGLPGVGAPAGPPCARREGGGAQGLQGAEHRPAARAARTPASRRSSVCSSSSRRVEQNLEAAEARLERLTARGPGADRPRARGGPIRERDARGRARAAAPALHRRAPGRPGAEGTAARPRRHRAPAPDPRQRPPCRPRRSTRAQEEVASLLSRRRKRPGADRDPAGAGRADAAVGAGAGDPDA